MRLLITTIVGLSLTISAQATEPKSKISQEKINCVPTGIPLNLVDEGTYSAEELNMLRNSIYAQVGFKFNTPKIADEMARRGCLKTDKKFTADSLDKVDKKNASLLKDLEQSLLDQSGWTDFQGSWEKAAKSEKKRADLLTFKYCFLSDAAGKYIGILNFGENKKLSGMMDVNKPSWGESLPAEQRNAYINGVANKELDSTAASFVLDYSTKGSWSVSSDGQPKISIAAKNNIKDVGVTISSPNYAVNGMLDCKLTK